MKNRGAIRGRTATENAKKASEDIAKQDFAETVKRARETKDFHYKSAAFLGQLAVKKVQQAEKGELSYAQADEEIKVLLNASKVSAEARKERFAVLGLDKEDLISNELPELVIHEMNPFEIDQIRAEQERRALGEDYEMEDVEVQDVESA
jgi:hypothetical protein